MVDEANQIVLEHLRHIRQVVGETRDDARFRTGLMERTLATAQVSEAGWNLEIDRVERRLELADG